MSLASTLLLIGCPEASRVAPLNFDAGPLAGVVLGIEPPDAGLWVDAGMVRAALGFSAVGALLDGGFMLIEAVEEGAASEVEALRGITITTTALRDYRIRVIDGSDQIVPSDETATELDGGLTYTIAFAQPLKPGKRYALTLEAQAGAQFTDVTGRPWDDIRLTLQVRGQPEAETGASGKPSKKKKKR